MVFIVFVVVAKKNLEFIQEIEEQPCINLESSNARLYEHVTEMQDIKVRFYRHLPHNDNS